MNNNWKEIYLNPFTGKDAENEFPAGFYSVLGAENGTGTRNHPFNSNKANFTHSTNRVVTSILGNGINDLDIYVTDSDKQEVYIIGQDRYNTILTGSFSGSPSSESSKYLHNLRIKDLTVLQDDNEQYFYINGCIVESITTIGGPAYEVISLTNSILKLPLNSDNFTNVVENKNNCFVGCSGLILSNEYIRNANYTLFKDCNIIIDSLTNLTPLFSSYLGFDNCRFKIGAEDDFKALQPKNYNGDVIENPTELEFRYEFKNRCDAQNITIPETTENGETVPVARWVFDNVSCTDTFILKGSIIDGFQKRRSINLGSRTYEAENIPVTEVINLPASIGPENPSGDNIVFDNDRLYLAPTFDITERNATFIESKVIYLNGKYKINAIDIVNNLPIENGLFLGNGEYLDYSRNITAIEENKTYLIRSTDQEAATIRYNDKIYSSSLIDRNNVFTGISGKISFETLTGSPLILEVSEQSLRQIVDIRVVDELPPDIIKDGILSPGTWYFVAPDSMADLTGKVIYNGIERPCFDSFCADDITTFDINGGCHLRRCWRSDYTPGTETTDRDFWQNKQKPQWVAVVPDDIRCLMFGNSAYSNEMKTDAAGNYIATGHPEFYKAIRGEGGVKIPSFDIVGAFLQIRIKVTTLNPM